MTIVKCDQVAGRLVLATDRVLAFEGWTELAAALEVVFVAYGAPDGQLAKASDSPPRPGTVTSPRRLG